jgi:hypothetical protein
VAYDLPFNTAGALNFFIKVPYSPVFVGVYLNGTFWDMSSTGNAPVLTSQAPPYMQPCPTTGPALCGFGGDGFLTLTELHDGDLVEFYPVAQDLTAIDLAPLLTWNGVASVPTIAGPRIGSAVMHLVAN